MADERETIIDREAKALERQYPELRDPDVAARVWKEAQRVAKGCGDPDLILRAWFLKLIYEARVGRRHLEQREAKVPPARAPSRRRRWLGG